MKLVGECNRCGRCCERWVNGVRFRCEHLATQTFIGLPGATMCRAYTRRYDGMPIKLVGPGIAIAATCGLDSPAEAQAIIELGIGKGCSLTIAEVPDANL